MLWIETTFVAIFAGPLMGVLVVTYFKLDELAARPVRVGRRRNLPPVDANGFPACGDPDGQIFLHTVKHL